MPLARSMPIKALVIKDECHEATERHRASNSPILYRQKELRIRGLGNQIRTS